MPPTVARRRVPAPSIRSTSRRPVRRARSPVPSGALLTHPSGVAEVVRQGPPIKLPKGPQDRDPRFQQVMKQLDQSAAGARKHVSASSKVAQAQAAALPPPNEKVAGARVNQVSEMSQAETSRPEATSFRAMLRAEIQKVMPKKVEDGQNFMKGDDRQQLKGAMTGNVEQQKGEATAGIEQAKNAPPDTGSVPGKPVTPLPGEPPAPTPVPVGAAQAMPPPAPDRDVSLEDGKKSTDQLMKSNELTSTQMEKANDPRFSRVNAEKSKADQFADSAPQKFRATEGGIGAQASAQAAAQESRSLQGMHQVQGVAAAGVRARQLTAKQKDEARRREVVEHIQGIFEKTKSAVDKKLEGLDAEVGALFDRGSDEAVQRMKDYVETRFDARYSGVGGKILKAKDWLLPLPPEVKTWFDESYAAFQQNLDALVERVANLVEQRLKETKAEINKGQAEIHTYVESLPEDLKAVGRTAQQEVNGKFDELRQGVEDKKSSLAQSLAQKYKEAFDKGQAALKEMKDAHKSLYEKVKEAVEEVLKVLREFRERVMNMLKKGKATIDLILADPIAFLKNLLNAIKQGLRQFVDNIWTHLKAGFMLWLFGSLADAGIEMPSDFSIGSILKLVTQVLGLTYARIRPKIVKIVGERGMVILEKAFELIKALWEGGPAALWEKIKEYLGDLKQMVIDAIQDWLISTVIKQATLKLVSMFNPVGAIIQAILMIYNTVMFLIDNIRRIMEFVEAVINSVYKIATGAIGDAANWIEQALARTVPIIIGFLARLLGISGITDKIVGFIKKIQTKVDEAVDKVIAKVVGGIGKLLGKGKGTGKPPEKPQDISDDAGADLTKELDAKFSTPVSSANQVRPIIQSLDDKYKKRGLKSIQLVESGENPIQYDVMIEFSPQKKGSKVLLKPFLRLSDLNLGFGATVLTATLGGRKVGPRGRFRNREGVHAEERLIKYMQENWTSLASPNKTYILELSITRSPCGANEHNCAAQLNTFILSRKQMGYSIRLVLNVLSIYGGLKKLDSIDALKLLRKSKNKHEINVLNVLEDVEEILGEDFDRKSLDNVTQKELNRRIEQVNKVLSDLNSIRAR